MHGQKILVVDDQYGIRVLVREVFEREGYKVYTAANGREALEMAEDVSPDLVILDMKIPGMDGIEILRRLKHFSPGIQVIMMTAYRELDLINQALDLGAVSHLIKPFDIDELKREVEQHLQSVI